MPSFSNKDFLVMSFLAIATVCYATLPKSAVFKTFLSSFCDSIRGTLDYDFAQEKRFPYEKLSALEAIRHIMEFYLRHSADPSVRRGNHKSDRRFYRKVSKDVRLRREQRRVCRELLVLPQRAGTGPTTTICKAASTLRTSFWSGSLKICCSTRSMS